MKIILFVGSPKQAHYFNKIANNFENSGSDILVITRDKECTLELVDYYFDKYEVIPFPSGFVRRVVNVFGTLPNIYKLLKSYNPDLVIGGVYPGLSFISKILGIPNIAICDTDHAWMTINLTIPFSDRLITGKSFNRDYGKKHIKSDIFFELSYVNPHVQDFHDKTFKKLDLNADEKTFLLRFAAYDANHDFGSSGLSLPFKHFLINKLQSFGKVIISSEKPTSSALSPYVINVAPQEFHSLLYNVDYCISDGSSTAVEAAFLGTRTFHFEFFFGFPNGKNVTNIIGNLDDIINKYKIFKTYTNEKKLWQDILIDLSVNKTNSAQKEKVKKLISECEDFVEVVVQVAEELVDWNESKTA